jgi:hypothetical protein
MDGAEEEGKPSGIALTRQTRVLFLLSLFASFEWFISGIVTLVITSDPKNSLIFGLSALRLLLVVGIWILAGLVLAGGSLARKKQVSLDSLWQGIQARNLRLPIYAISIILMVWGWLALFCPPYLFGKYLFFFERVQPFSIALAISLAQSWLLVLFSRGRLGFFALGKPAFRKYFRPSLLFAVVLIVLGVFIGVTRFGLLTNVDFTYVPGIPLSSLQLFFILLMACLCFVIVPEQAHDRPLIKFIKKYRLVPIFIFMVTFLVWQRTPMLRDFFSLEPAAPSYQPFPYADARVYDLGAISILRGYGINYYNNENPLYLIFLAVLHFFAGFNYKTMTWMQLLVLAFVPVILFLLGKKYHSAAFGVFLSLGLIFRQGNAMTLSYKVSSLNPKLFMTEEMALLGIVLFAYLVFRWMSERKIWLACLSGGCIGATALLRLNTLVLFFAIACLIVPAFWKMGRQLVFKHVSVYSLAFLALLVPWLLSSVGPDGYPWFLYKIHLIIEQRYGSTVSSAHRLVDIDLPGVKIGEATHTEEENEIPSLRSVNLQGQAVHGPALTAPLQTAISTVGNVHQTPHAIFPRFMYHLLHNFSTSVLALPDSLRYDGLTHLVQRVYWVSGGEDWHGNLPAGQAVLIVLNLLLVALGLGYAWVRYRWAGMIPLAIFLAYDISLSAAMNSGGRYLPPLDWVIFFYYGLAIVAIMQFVWKVLAGKMQIPLAGSHSDPARPYSDRRNLVFSLVGILLFASLIPLANFALPAGTASARHREEVEATMQTLPAQQNPSARILSGKILYPYAYADKLNFDFLTLDGDVINFAIPRDTGVPLGLRSGESAYIAMQGDVGNDNLQVQSIYLWQGTDATLIWQAQP